MEKISREVMEAGKNNGLKPEGIMLADKVLKENILKKNGKKKPNYKIYQEVMNSNVSREVADAKMSEKSVRNDKIKKTILEVMEAGGLDDKSLTKKHKELLNKKEVVKRFNIKTNEVEIIPTNEIDTTAVKSALDMAYKLKGHYNSEENPTSTITNITQINIDKLSNKEVNDKIMDIIQK